MAMRVSFRKVALQAQQFLSSFSESFKEAHLFLAIILSYLYFPSLTKKTFHSFTVSTILEVAANSISEFVFDSWYHGRGSGIEVGSVD